MARKKTIDELRIEREKAEQDLKLRQENLRKLRKKEAELTRIDFVMEFYGKSFPEAVEMLTGEKGEGQQEAVPAPSSEFHLQIRNVTSVNARNYLVEQRGMDEGIVDHFINRGDIYEDIM